MLVLSRRAQESIVLPNCDVMFTILSIHGTRVRLGIAAPKEIEIHRLEGWERIQNERIINLDLTIDTDLTGPGFLVPLLPK